MPAGQGTSVVELYRHTSANTYRVVARCLFDQSVCALLFWKGGGDCINAFAALVYCTCCRTTHTQVVINSPLYPNLEYRRATETFHQWQVPCCCLFLLLLGSDQSLVLTESIFIPLA